ncbi:MAG: MotA/TolQ/ExbB proton channel family protein [Isosphaeraceae bacterium]|nr:MotA/TolQ/ExbB proton channel family protein [Isosphaeraceae bacterium]
MIVRSRRLALSLVGWLLLFACGVLPAQEPPKVELAPAAPEASGESAPPPKPVVDKIKAATAKGAGAVNRQSILALFTRANPMVWLLAVCSVVAVGYALERLVALRRERVIPRDFVNRFLERLATGKLDRDRAAELCRANDSPAARVFALIVSYWGQPAATIRQAIGYDAAGEVTDLKRNVRVLNGTATLAPLLGLLGTVIGMIQSFDALGGRVGPAKGESLAQGISLALVSTALGLAIAVVSVAAYYFLLNRVDILVRELDDQARQVIDLVSGESMRPALPDRRPTPGLAAPADHARQETRTL